MFPWADDPVLAGGGECGALLRSLDWKQNPLGPPDAWPAELRTLVGVMLPALQPMFVCWGPERIMIYNDAYAPLCGKRHPAGLGMRFRELWHDIWHVVEPLVDKAFAGIGTQMDDIQFTMFRHGHAEETHFSYSYTPVCNSRNCVEGFFCACMETTHLVMARKRQQSELERLKTLFAQAPAAIAVLEGPFYRFALANDAFLNLVRSQDVLGKPVRSVFSTDTMADYITLLDAVYQSGEARVGTAVPFFNKPADTAASTLYIDFVYQPIKDDLGNVTSIFVLAFDATDRVQRDNHREARNTELIHRLKNQLAMLQAIVSQTLRNAPDLQAAADSINARLGALARAHGLLVDGETGTAAISDLVQSMRAVHDTIENPRIVATGPEADLQGRAALSLSLIFNELATNSTKYGALSMPEGRVEITWSASSDQEGSRLELEWMERDGPRVMEPTKRGTGTRLIRAGLDGAARSKVTLDFRPAGLQCRIEASGGSLMVPHN